MERIYKGYTIGKCETVAELCGSNLKWLVHTPTHLNVRFCTLKEAKIWINKKIAEA